MWGDDRILSYSHATLLSLHVLSAAMSETLPYFPDPE